MIALIRYREGLARPSQRQVHLVEIDISMLENIEAKSLSCLCGEEIPKDAFEVLGTMRGMPCVKCLSEAPEPEEDRIPLQTQVKGNDFRISAG